MWKMSEHRMVRASTGWRVWGVAWKRNLSGVLSRSREAELVPLGEFSVEQENWVLHLPEIVIVRGTPASVCDSEPSLGDVRAPFPLPTSISELPQLTSYFYFTVGPGARQLLVILSSSWSAMSIDLWKAAEMLWILPGGTIPGCFHWLMELGPFCRERCHLFSVIRPKE